MSRGGLGGSAINGARHKREKRRQRAASARRETERIVKSPDGTFDTSQPVSPETEQEFLACTFNEIRPEDLHVVIATFNDCINGSCINLSCLRKDT